MRRNTKKDQIGPIHKIPQSIYSSSDLIILHGFGLQDIEQHAMNMQETTRSFIECRVEPPWSALENRLIAPASQNITSGSVRETLVKTHGAAEGGGKVTVNSVRVFKSERLKFIVRISEFSICL